MHHKSADNVQQNVVCHDESTYGNAQAFCKDHRHDFDAVHGASVPDGSATAQSGYQTAEQGAKQQILSGKGGGDAHIHRQNVRDEPCSKGIDGDGIDRIDRKRDPLFFQTIQEQRNVQQDQKHRKAPDIWCDLCKEHGGTGNAAVV